MEFWGVEVKSGQPLDVSLDGKVLHLSQASLGELKKDKVNESVCLRINVEGKNLVLGTLHSERLPQQMFDLVFDKDFKISHNWKNGSVYFYGYKADQNNDSDLSDDFDSFGEEDEDIPLPVSNGKQEVKVNGEKSEPEKSNAAKGSAAGKQKVKIVEPGKENKAEKDDSDDSDSDDVMSEDDSEEDDEDSSDEEVEDDEDSDEEDEETPKKQQSGKKRPNDSAMKTPGTDKKAKVTAQKSDEKKGAGHVATPHPSKQTGKTPGNKSNQKSPATEGSHACKSCNRSFKSENALQSHNQAKHK